MKHPSADPLPRGARRSRARRAESGFALLLTVTLLAFLVLILVALASLSRVETQVAGNAQQLAQARQNALMALNIALGQLQKYAGPDQRVTGTADLAGQADGGRLPSGGSGGAPTATKLWTTTGNGLRQIQPGTRYWTGVWRNNLTPNEIYTTTPSAVLLNWLISGNESASFDTGLGATTEGAGYTYRPDIAVSDLSGITSTAALIQALTEKTITINSQEAVLLVGPNSAGTDARTLPDGSTEAAVDRYIVAPLQPITADTALVPGAETAAIRTVGRYAYWIGDEGVKARINLVDRYASHSDTVSDPEARYRLMTPPRSGLETLLDFRSTAYKSWSQATDASPRLDRALQVPQLRFMEGSTVSSALAGVHLHNLTAHSAGIEADALHGGLRKDLTYYFENALSSPAANNVTLVAGTSSADSTVNGNLPAAPSSGLNIIPGADASNTVSKTFSPGKGPTWDILHNFYNLALPSGASISAQAASSSKTGVAPVLVQARMLLGANATTGQAINVLFTPLLMLANPYPVPLKISGLRVKFSLLAPKDGAQWPGSIMNRVLQYAVGPDASANGGHRFYAVFSYHHDHFGPEDDAETPAESLWPASVTGGVHFTLPDITFAPGEAKLFTVSGRTDVTAASAGTPVTVALSTGDPLDFAASYHYVYKTTARASPAAGGGGQYYKINESDSFTPAQIDIEDADGATIRRTIVNIDASTNSFGIYYEPNGATNTGRVIAMHRFELIDPGTVGATSERLYADFNPRAAFFRLTNHSGSSAPGFARDSSVTSQINSANAAPETVPAFFYNDLDPDDFSWGRSKAPTPLKAVLYDVPRRDAAGELPILSLGHLQHANVTADDERINVGHQPGYAIGNSYAPVFVSRSSTHQLRPDRYPGNGGTTLPSTSFNKTSNYYDLSYRLNAALWDGYFFSTFSQTQAAGSPAESPLNPRLNIDRTYAPQGADVKNGSRAAAYVRIAGAFNINSTSVDAWAAFLAGMRNLPALSATGAATNADVTIFPRSIRQPAEAATPQPTGDGDDSYRGFRRLTDDQIKALATEIVKQVRLRGPFTSLAQFVNRMLIDATTDAATGYGFSGALQSAIDAASAAGTNLNQFSQITPASDLLQIPTWAETFYADGPSFHSTSKPAYRSTAIPGWLTQGDVLQAIGPVIAARSDTFVIRTYGDAGDPEDQPTGRAWCEAVVQRLPEYVDHKPFSSTAGTGNRPTDVGTALDSTNQLLGRRFKVISFRWLTPDDI